jgi:GT2 family glycosyltransferase
VSYFETKKREPDYLATHALAIDSVLFKKSGGFPEDFLPILEDVEFSHRLRGSGYRLVMDPRILVRHIFRFTLLKSLRNAFRKSMFWTLYSLKTGDLLADSGTASLGLKVNGFSFLSDILFVVVFLLSREKALLLLIPLTSLLNIAVNRGLLSAFSRAKGFSFAFAATAYYMVLYPLPVVAGAAVAMFRHFLSRGKIL